MEDIRKLVDDSLARHGIKPSLNHGRLDWSQWFPCQSSLSMLHAPAKPGIFALGEDMVPAAGPVAEAAEGGAGGKRMLALFQISEADDLGMALGRLFLPSSPARERLASGRCFARYAVIEDPVERLRAQQIFERRIGGSTEARSGIKPEPSSSDAATPLNRAEHRSAWAAGNLTDFPCGGPAEDSVAPDFLALAAERQNRESTGTACPLPMPSGF